MSRRRDDSSALTLVLGALVVGVGAYALTRPAYAAPPPQYQSGGGGGGGGAANNQPPAPQPPAPQPPAAPNLNFTPTFTPEMGAGMAYNFLNQSGQVAGGIVQSLIERGVFDRRDDDDADGNGNGGGGNGGNGGGGGGNGGGGGLPYDQYGTSPRR